MRGVTHGETRREKRCYLDVFHCGNAAPVVEIHARLQGTVDSHHRWDNHDLIVLGNCTGYLRVAVTHVLELFVVIFDVLGLEKGLLGEWWNGTLEFVHDDDLPKEANDFGVKVNQRFSERWWLVIVHDKRSR